MTRNKEWLKDRLKYGIILGKCRPGHQTDIEVGGSFLCDISVAFDEKPELFEDSEIKDLFEKAIKGIEKLIVECNNDYFLLHATFVPGRKIFSDKKKHWWWWLPEKVMNKEQLKDWETWVK